MSMWLVPQVWAVQGFRSPVRCCRALSWRGRHHNQIRQGPVQTNPIRAAAIILFPRYLIVMKVLWAEAGPALTGPVRAAHRQPKQGLLIPLPKPVLPAVQRIRCTGPNALTAEKRYRACDAASLDVETKSYPFISSTTAVGKVIAKGCTAIAMSGFFSARAGKCSGFTRIASRLASRPQPWPVNRVW